MEKPLVYGDGAATLVLGQSGCVLSVGTYDINYYDKIMVNVNGQGNVELYVHFLKSHDQEVTNLIEENIRLVKSVPWIKIIRGDRTLD